MKGTLPGWGPWTREWKGDFLCMRSGPNGLEAIASNQEETDHWTVTLNGRQHWIAQAYHASRELAFRMCLAALAARKETP